MTPRKKTAAKKPNTQLRILSLRDKLKLGQISLREFRELITSEERINVWAARVQLRSVARDLIPEAAKQARNGRSRLLAVIGNILLDSERIDTGTKMQTAPQIEITHNVGRPDRSQYDPALQTTIEEMVTETLEKKVGAHADEHTTKH